MIRAWILERRARMHVRLAEAALRGAKEAQRLADKAPDQGTRSTWIEVGLALGRFAARCLERAATCHTRAEGRA